MKIQVELTHEIINALSPEDCKEALRQLIPQIKSDVDERIEKIKSQVIFSEPAVISVINDKPVLTHTETVKPEFNHPSQTIPNSVLKEIQKRYDEGERSLMMLLNEDYPQYSYSTVYGHITLKKKVEKVVKYLDYVEPQEDEQLKIAVSHIKGEHKQDYGNNPINKKQAVIYCLNPL